eukprot:5341531-Pleurochrysis_carterae.AAC.2
MNASLIRRILARLTACSEGSDDARRCCVHTRSCVSCGCAQVYAGYGAVELLYNDDGSLKVCCASSLLSSSGL